MARNNDGEGLDKKLFIAALAKFAAGFVIVGLLLFVPAGTIAWWQGWLFMGILFAPMFIAGLVMMAKAPDLLRKRLSADEDESEQKTVQALSALMFIAAFVVAGLGFRFGWAMLPDWASWVGAVVLQLPKLLNALADALIVYSHGHHLLLCINFSNYTQYSGCDPV